MPAAAPGLTPSPLPRGVRWAQLALGLGFAVLVGFLVLLEGVFVAEKGTQREQLHQHRLALEAYATSRFRQLADDALSAARQTAQLAREDPLQPTSGAVLFVDGALVVPYRAGGQAADAVPAVDDTADAGGRPSAVDATFALLRGAPPRADDDSPWAERRRLLSGLRAAAAQGDRPRVEATVRQLLAHRAHFVLPPEEDLPSVVVLLDALAPPLRVSPALARALLRDGLGAPEPAEGLERQVLRAAPRLGVADVERLCAETQRLARANGVRVDDFTARCREAVQPLPRAPLDVPAGPSAWLEGSGAAAWLWQTRGGEVVGAAFDEGAQRLGLAEEMRELGLFVAGDALGPPGLHTSSWGPPGEDDASPAARQAAETGRLALDEVRLAAHVKRFDEAERQQHTAFLLKTALVAVASLLGVAMVATALLAQRRKQRFVELKNDFVATVSHELRTPLASLRLMAETLERKLEGAGVARDYPQRMVREVDGLSFLVENILSFNRIDKGRLVARRQPAALDAFVPQLRDEAAQYSAAKVELSFEGFEGRTVLADVGLLQLLFTNLLRNACRYNANDPVRVRFEALGEPGAVVVRVTDNGVGLTAVEREAVFEPFVRGEKRGRGGPGSGLGLALCRRIAELHGGSLKVADSSPQGTTFLLRLSASRPG